MTRLLRSRGRIALAAILAARRRASTRRRALRAAALGPESGRVQHRAARVADGARAPRSRLVRLPVPADGRAGARSGALRWPVVPRGPLRRRRARARRGRRNMVARPPRVRHRCGDRRRCGGRRGDDPRRLFADGRHGRAADARRHLRARARRRGPHRVGRARGRSRRVRQVSGSDRGRARDRCRVGEVEGARTGRCAGGCRVRAHEPVRAHPRGSCLGRHLARPAPGPGRLARVRERSDRTARLPRPAPGCGRPVADRGGGRCRGGAPSPHEDRSDPALVRARLLADADAAAGPLRALHPPARPRPGRPRRQRPAGGAVRARGARAPARLERVRRARA